MTTVSLSGLVEEVISEYIKYSPGLRASFEIENNILVQGDYSALKIAVEKLIASAIRCTLMVEEPSILFGQIESEQVYFIMDNGGGFNLHESDGIAAHYRYLGKNKFGEELPSGRRIIVRHGGSVWGAEQDNVGALFYFSLN